MAHLVLMENIANLQGFRLFCPIKEPPENLPPAEKLQWIETMKAEERRLAALALPPAPLKKLKLPNMRTFPMKFRVFLRHMFGGRLHSERLRLYRKFLLQQFEIEVYFKGHRDVHSPQSRIAAAEKLRDDFIAKLSREGITDVEWFAAVDPEIQRWRSLNRIAQRKAAIKSRWDREKRKKILELSKVEGSGISKNEKCSLVPKKHKKGPDSYPKK